MSTLSSPASVSISKHTTTSVPRPHILYIVKVTDGGKTYEVSKRYSEFMSLHNQLGDPFALPPKRLLVTTFIPSAWADDELIAERKAGFTTYLSNLLSTAEFRAHSALIEFLASDITHEAALNFDFEDALPSTLSRKAALQAQAAMGPATYSTPIAAAYYPDWSGDSNPPENLDYSKFDVLYFAFATPNSSSALDWDDGATDLLQRLVSSANSSGQGTKIVLSIGGWSGSYWFSQTMSTSSNRQTFLNAAVNAVNTYGLSGIDIDWEYPYSEGAGNPNSSADSANLLDFFTSLRSALGSSAIISAAVTDLPWLGSDGNPISDMSAYAAQMTYANIMNYDINGSGSNPGPNAPLGNLCGTSNQPQYTAEAALSQWTAAKFPANQLVLGLPLYGYVSQTTATALSGSLVGDMQPSENIQRVLACRLPQVKEQVKEQEQGVGKPNFLNGNHARVKGKAAAKPSPADSGDLSSYYGQQIPFNQIIALGALQKQSDGAYTATNGYTDAWDNCSDTPYIYDTSRDTVVTYDDTYSLGDKATFAKQNGMAGCFTWSLDQDDGYTLQDVIRSNLGK